MANGNEGKEVEYQPVGLETIRRDGEQPVPIPEPIPENQIANLQVDASVSLGDRIILVGDTVFKKAATIGKGTIIITKLFFVFINTLNKLRGVEMEESKKWWQSKTIWGILIAAICTVLQLFGVVEIPAADQSKFLDSIWSIIVAVLDVIGWVLALIGRAKAVKPIG